MTHDEAIAAVIEVVTNPPDWAVQKGKYGVTEWSPRGFDEWFAPAIHRIEHAVKGNVMGRKNHAYEFEPGWYDGVHISDKDICDGGCCDGMYAYVRPWTPYPDHPTYW